MGRGIYTRDRGWFRLVYYFVRPVVASGPVGPNHCPDSKACGHEPAAQGWAIVGPAYDTAPAR